MVAEWSAKRKAERERLAAKVLRKKLKVKVCGEEVEEDDVDGIEMNGDGVSVDDVLDYFMDVMKSIGYRRTTSV